MAATRHTAVHRPPHQEGQRPAARPAIPIWVGAAQGSRGRHGGRAGAHGLHLRDRHEPRSARGCDLPPHRPAPRPRRRGRGPHRPDVRRRARLAAADSAPLSAPISAAVLDRDPACTRYLEPLLYFKGFHALVTYRFAHELWRQGRRDFALYLQSQSSRIFAVDIHPAARLGKGLMLDHATGFVVGETAVVGDNCSFLHARDARRQRQGNGRPASEDRRRRAHRRRRQGARQYPCRQLLAHCRRQRRARRTCRRT